MREIGIGLLGFGTVGTGVVEGLRKNADIIEKRLNARLVVRMIADIDLERDRGVDVGSAVLVRDGDQVINSNKVDVVVELIGGTGVALDFIMKALDLGKPVVTANKALLAAHGNEIFELAAGKNVDIYFGASVGGGIPVIRAIREGLIANRIDRIHGILNGTCNYILTQMEEKNLSFDEALAEAQAKGYAEADPGLDIDGFDTAHKTVILASLACGQFVPMSAVKERGIRGLSIVDIKAALDMGYRIKLLSAIQIEETDGDLSLVAQVQPMLVPFDNRLASVNGVFNAVMVHGDMTGDTLYYGRGAGREPTAATVIGDIADIARNIISGCPRRVQAVPSSGKKIVIKDGKEFARRCYLRFPASGDNSRLKKVFAVLEDVGIVSRQSTITADGDMIVLTDKAREECFTAALEKITCDGILDEDPVKLSIVE